MKNTIIYLIGFPGTGKRTIASEICRQASMILVDNQSVNFPLFNVVGADGKTPLPEQIWENTKKIWDVVFDTMINLAPSDCSYALTNCLVNDDPGDKEQFERVKLLAEKRNASFVPVRLICSVEEMEKRIVQPERKKYLKEVNPESPRYNAEKYTIFNPEGADLFSLDVTNLQPVEAAKTVLSHAGERILNT